MRNMENKKSILGATGQAEHTETAPVNVIKLKLSGVLSRLSKVFEEQEGNLREIPSGEELAVCSEADQSFHVK